MGDRNYNCCEKVKRRAIEYDTYLKNSILNKSKAPNKNTAVKDSIKM